MATRIRDLFGGGKDRPEGVVQHTVGNALVVHAEDAISPEAQSLALSMIEDAENDVVVLDLGDGMPISAWESMAGSAAAPPPRHPADRLRPARQLRGDGRSVAVRAAQPHSHRPGRRPGPRLGRHAVRPLRPGQRLGAVPARPPAGLGRQALSDAGDGTGPRSTTGRPAPPPRSSRSRPGSGSTATATRRWSTRNGSGSPRRAVPAGDDDGAAGLPRHAAAVARRRGALLARARRGEPAAGALRAVRRGPDTRGRGVRPGAGRPAEHRGHLLHRRAGRQPAAVRDPDGAARTARSAGRRSPSNSATRPRAHPNSRARRPTVLSHRPPLAGAEEIAPRVYWFAPDAVVEVVQAGLWVRSDRRAEERRAGPRRDARRRRAARSSSTTPCSSSARPDAGAGARTWRARVDGMAGASGALMPASVLVPGASRPGRAQRGPRRRTRSPPWSSTSPVELGSTCVEVAGARPCRWQRWSSRRPWVPAPSGRSALPYVPAPSPPVGCSPQSRPRLAPVGRVAEPAAPAGLVPPAEPCWRLARPDARPRAGSRRRAVGAARPDRPCCPSRAAVQPLAHGRASGPGRAGGPRRAA